MPFDKYSPIITVYRDGIDTPYQPIDESLIVDSSGKVILTEIPDSFQKLQIQGDNKTWIETDKDNIPLENEYIVDYPNRMVTFHKSNIGKQLKFRYMGTGLTLISADQIYTETDGLNVKETLGEIVEAGRKSVENLKDLNDTILRAEEAISNTDGAITNANNSATNANNKANLAQQKIDSLNTLETNINTAIANSETATTNANNSATNATTQANYAKAQGDYALQQGDLAKQIIKDVGESAGVTSINGMNGAIVLDASDVGAIPSSEKGVADGVAKLNAQGKVVDALGNEVEGKVKSVNNEVPDVNGNINIDLSTYATKTYTDTKSNEAVNTSKAYTDNLITSVTESGVPSLANYPYILTANTDGQLDYEIPLTTFNKNTDALALVVLNRTTLDINDFTVTDNIQVGRTLTLQVDSSEIKSGDTIYILILKNVPVGTEGNFSGSYLTNDSVPKSKLSPALRTEIEGKVDSVNGLSGDVLITVPTKTSELTNDSGYLNTLPTASEITITDSSNLFTATNVESALSELFTNVSNGKGQIATAITDKGVTTSSSDTFTKMASNIALIETGIKTDDATAITGDILNGKTAYAKGSKLTGTLALSGTASASNVLTGQTFYNTDAKTKVTGTMANNGSLGTVTPSTTNKNYSAGYYNAFVVAGSSNLTASNIKSGVNIFGVTGNYTGSGQYYTTEQYVYVGSRSYESFTLNVGFPPKYWYCTIVGISLSDSGQYNTITIGSNNIATTVNTTDSTWGTRGIVNVVFDSSYTYASGNTLYARVNLGTTPYSSSVNFKFYVFG